MMLWGIAAPFGAILFQSVKTALPQFLLYIMVCVGVLIMEFYFPPGWERPGAAASFGLLLANFSGFIFFIYVNLAHYARAREVAMQSLDQEHRLLKEEQDRSERLLLNILPPAIARRLKGNEKYIADAHREVTILFADIVDFTPLSVRLSAEDLVQILNQVFSHFDVLAEKYGLEKIKTIGDAYMVAGGLPELRKDHAEACALMALDMQSVMETFEYGEVRNLKLRIGINTGPVVAGVIGSRKFIYDLWGDAVNTASRMESHGAAGEIQISARTREGLGSRFHCEERGIIEIKGKGPMMTYILRGQLHPPG
ncbi:MAG: hypothetical protein HS115_07190 [Spirochaetales bacterium]|nr:hypothetical protein [Spirochaetales bacterium]